MLGNAALDAGFFFASSQPSAKQHKTTVPIAVATWKQAAALPHRFFPRAPGARPSCEKDSRSENFVIFVLRHDDFGDLRIALRG